MHTLPIGCMEINVFIIQRSAYKYSETIKAQVDQHWIHFPR